MGATQDSLARINYILFIASFLIGGISLVGLVIAYAVRTSDADDFVNSHFSYQIRTFWIFVTVMAIQLVLLAVVVLIDRPSDMALLGSIAIVILIAIGMNVWYVVRSAIGLKALSQSEPLAV